MKQDDPRFWEQISEWQRLGIIRPRGYNLASPYAPRPRRDIQRYLVAPAVDS